MLSTNPLQVSLVQKRRLTEGGLESYTFDVRTKFAVQRYEVYGRDIDEALERLTSVVSANLKGSMQGYEVSVSGFNEQGSTRVTGAVILAIAGATLGLQWIVVRIAKLIRGGEEAE